MKSLKLTKMNGCLKVQYTKLYITKYITISCIFVIIGDAKFGG